MESSKVCFITIRNIFNTSSLPKYAEITNGEFDIIYWDQHGLEEVCGAKNYNKFEYKINYGGDRIRKIIGYIKFKRFANKIIRENKYEKLIVLPTQTALLFYFLLTLRYKKKYVLDIRDYTKEKNFLFYFIMKILVKNSGVSVITSPAYKRFLPKHEYLLSHNITRIDKNVIEKYRNREKTNEKINISCIGSIRFLEQFKKVIEVFANDDRFQLSFIGRGSERLQKFCEVNSIDNVRLIGHFENEKTIGFYLKTDIILNLYGNDSPFLDYALSNKLYYSAILGIPILVSPNTYMEEVTLESGLGFSYDLEKDIRKEELYKYYKEMDWHTFYNNCDVFVEKVMNEEKIFKTEMERFIQQ